MDAYRNRDSDSEEEIYPQLPRRRYRERINFDQLSDRVFKEKFRLRHAEAEALLLRIGRYLEHETDLNHALSPQKQLLLALHFLGNGGQYHGVADMHGVGKATVCRALWDVVHAIVDHVFQDVVRWPTNCNNLANDFIAKGGFPYCAGVVDGTLIKISKPSQNEEAFVDRKGNHSLNVLLICGPDRSFYCVNANMPGSCHDSRVLRQTYICQRFDEGWRPFPGAVVIGDSAYGLSDWLIPPIFRNPNNDAERRFQRCHKKTRTIIEHSFGMLKARFPCLNFLRLVPQRAGLVVLACATLHNLATKGDFPPARALEDEDVEVGEFPDGNERVEEILEFFM